jgi:hypothetical protein
MQFDVSLWQQANRGRLLLPLAEIQCFEPVHLLDLINECPFLIGTGNITTKDFNISLFSVIANYLVLKMNDGDA